MSTKVFHGKLICGAGIVGTENIEHHNDRASVGFHELTFHSVGAA